MVHFDRNLSKEDYNMTITYYVDDRCNFFFNKYILHKAAFWHELVPWKVQYDRRNVVLQVQTQWCVLSKTCLGRKLQLCKRAKWCFFDRTLSMKKITISHTSPHQTQVSLYSINFMLFWLLTSRSCHIWSVEILVELGIFVFF